MSNTEFNRDRIVVVKMTAGELEKLLLDLEAAGIPSRRTSPETDTIVAKLTGLYRRAAGLATPKRKG